MGRFAVCCIKNTVVFVIRMKCKASQAGCQSGLVNKIWFPFRNIEPGFSIPVAVYIFYPLVEDEPGFCASSQSILLIRVSGSLSLLKGI